MRKYKTIICGLIIAICTTIINLSAVAEDNIKLYINEYQSPVTNRPQIVNDRVLVPLRDAFSAIGVPNIIWNAAEQKIMAEKNNVTVIMQIGQEEYTIKSPEGEMTYTMDVAPIIIDSFTYVPARYAGEAFGYGVEWDANNKIVRFVGDDSFLGYDENTPKTLMSSKSAWKENDYYSFSLYFLNDDSEIVVPSGYLYVDIYSTDNLNMYHIVAPFDEYDYNEDKTLQFNIPESALPKTDSSEGYIKVYVSTNEGPTFHATLSVSELPTKY